MVLPSRTTGVTLTSAHCSAGSSAHGYSSRRGDCCCSERRTLARTPSPSTLGKSFPDIRTTPSVPFWFSREPFAEIRVVHIRWPAAMSQDQMPVPPWSNARSNAARSGANGSLVSPVLGLSSCWLGLGAPASRRVFTIFPREDHTPAHPVIDAFGFLLQRTELCSNTDALSKVAAIRTPRAARRRDRAAANTGSDLTSRSLVI